MIWIKRAKLVGLLLVGTANGACSSGSDTLLGSDGSSASSGAGAGGRETLGEHPDRVPAPLGEPCVADDEWSPYFSGFSSKEVNIITLAPQCETQVCLLNHFQGRASCPYGQAPGAAGCLVPGGSVAVTVGVHPQLEARQTSVASICSCRCAGDGPGPYCTCPDSMQCEHVFDDIGVGDSNVPGSYCIPKGSQYDASQSTAVCVEGNCGPAHPY